ncbi:uncharacterized protein LOC121799453 [Salvia splendens]|nr:uncharacterized protein LOC121799453 [Salvia splendens]
MNQSTRQHKTPKSVKGCCKVSQHSTSCSFQLHPSYKYRSASASSSPFITKQHPIKEREEPRKGEEARVKQEQRQGLAAQVQWRDVVARRVNLKSDSTRLKRLSKRG